jgi:carboxylesterase
VAISITNTEPKAPRDHGYRLGDGRTGFLLLHGLSGTPMELRYQALGLSRAGFRVHVPQLAGHCGTLDDLRATTWRDWSDSASAALTELARDCDTVVVGGLSMGAVLSAQLAIESPDLVDGVAMLAPTFRFDGWAVPWYAPLFNLVNDRWTADRFMFREIEPYGIKDRRLRDFVLKALTSDVSATAGIPPAGEGCREPPRRHPSARACRSSARGRSRLAGQRRHVAKAPRRARVHSGPGR